MSVSKGQELLCVFRSSRKEEANRRMDVRTICKYRTSVRRISSVSWSESKLPARSSEAHHGRMTLDTLADTIVLGKNGVVLSFTGRECDVAPFTEAYDPIQSIPIVTGAVAWTSPFTGATFVLVLNEALWMPDKMDDTIVNPNQLRHYGVVVQDNPYSGSPLYIMKEDKSFCMDLKADGTNIFADTRQPTQEELETCPRIVLTSPHPWDPHSVRFPEPQRSMEEEIGMRRVSAVQVDEQDHEGVFVDAQELYNPGDVYKRLISTVKITSVPVRRVSAVQQDVPAAKTFHSKERHSDVSPENLSERWGISLHAAKETLKRTTQRILRSAVLPLARRYRADRMFKKKRLDGEWSSDTLVARVTSKDGNKYAQVFANTGYFAAIYPMDSKGKAGDALKTFCAEFGVPEKLTFDGSKEQTARGTEFMKQVRRNDINYHVIEPDRHNQNPCEGVIREIRRKWFRIMVRRRVPRRLWDYGMRWVAETSRMTYTTAGGLSGGGIPLEAVTGETQDISEYLDFGFYDYIWYHENAGLGERKFGRWLGVSHRVGSLMSYWVLTDKGSVISRTTVQRVTNLELQTDEVKQQAKEYDDEIKRRFKEDDLPTDGDKPDPEHWADLIETDEDFYNEFVRIVNDDELPEADKEFTPDVLDDTYLHMELALPRDGDGPEFARVTKRLKDKDGLPIGVANEHPILDTRMYEVEYADGHKASLSANAIAQNLFAQIDEEGNRHVLLDAIIDHRVDGSEVKQQDAFIVNKSGQKRRVETTKGWELLVQWKDGSTSWVALKDMKESFPVQVAEYSVESSISEEPAFAWWVRYVLNKRNRIIAKTKSKYWLRTHKFGIKIPKNVEQAKKFDEENGDTQWWDAICKEMRNVRIAFEEWEGSIEELPPGYQEVKCHMVFDVKMGENFRRKARMVAGGHTTDTPSTITYSSVVSRDSVRIALTIAALNDLDILSCDIQNAYLTAKCRERIYTKAGPEFGSDAGKWMIVTRALYGLKSSGAAFRALLADTLREAGYESTKADPDVWIRPAVKPDGFEYYELVLCYVDDVISISHKPMETMDMIRKRFTLKGDKAEVPEMYLGAQLSKMTTSEGISCWTISSEKYCKAAVANVEDKLRRDGKRLPTGCTTPLKSNYRPEMDDSPELKAEGVQYYQELIGVLRWAVELGRVDILLEVSLMSAHLAMPRLGHLDQVLHMFAYLKWKPKRRIAMDPTNPKISERKFKRYDWEDFYRGAKEAIPGDMPEPRGLPMSMTAFVDADLAGNKKTRRSQTGLLIFCNRAPIIWYSKGQNRVEASTFGSEFMAMKTAVEQVEALRYKLRMFGVPIDGPTNVFGDNEAVVKNTSIPESVLKKKCHSIAYHRCREAVAAGTVRIAKEGTSTNLSDLFTKLLAFLRREELLNKFTY